MTKHEERHGQLGFDALLSDADSQNRAREFERETAHLPKTMEEALPFFRLLLEQHHAAMLAADLCAVYALREEADLLAFCLNGGKSGILAGPDAPGCALGRLTAATPGEVPLWGQTGVFIVEAAGIKARIEIDGVYGVGSSVLFWHGFSAHCVDPDQPFISETGYRSFLGIRSKAVPGMSPDMFARDVLEAFTARDLKGRLVAVDRKYLSTDA